jgi:hypothetical protein
LVIPISKEVAYFAYPRQRHDVAIAVDHLAVPSNPRKRRDARTSPRLGRARWISAKLDSIRSMNASAIAASSTCAAVESACTARPAAGEDDAQLVLPKPAREAPDGGLSDQPTSRRGSFCRKSWFVREWSGPWSMTSDRVVIVASTCAGHERPAHFAVAGSSAHE